MASELTVAERSRLHELEAQVHRGLTSFLEVGRALQEIRDGRLYRATHTTFAAYCADRWDFSRQHVNRLIRSVGIVNSLEPIGSRPENEAQARVLAGVAPEVRREVWRAASADGLPTAARLAELTARALESLPPAEQREVVEREQSRLHHEAREERERDA